MRSRLSFEEWRLVRRSFQEKRNKKRKKKKARKKRKMSVRRRQSLSRKWMDGKRKKERRKSED